MRFFPWINFMKIFANHMRNKYVDFFLVAQRGIRSDSEHPRMAEDSLEKVQNTLLDSEFRAITQNASEQLAGARRRTRHASLREQDG